MESDNILQDYRVAKLYYEEELSQQEIAEREHISRSQISRMLKRARESGLVRIELALPPEQQREYLASQLRETLGLREAVVLGSDSGSLAQSPARDAAAYVQTQIARARTIGIGWGGTIFRISQQLEQRADRKERTFVSLIGTAGSDNPALQTNSIVDRFAEKYQARTHYNNFKCCVFLSQMNPSDQRRWQELTQKWERMDLALIGLGNSHQTSEQYSVEFENQRLVTERIEQMTGDILGNFFNENGAIYEYPNGAHASSPKLSALKRIEKVICVAWGAQKVEAIRCAAKLHYFNYLVTDHETAIALLRTPDAGSTDR